MGWRASCSRDALVEQLLEQLLEDDALVEQLLGEDEDDALVEQLLGEDDALVEQGR